MTSPQPRSTDAIAILWRWYVAEVGALQRMVVPRGDTLMLGGAVWGKAYIERFAHYCLPTIAAPKNLAALGGNARLVLFTDTMGQTPLVEMLKPLAQWGLPSQVLVMPPEVIDLANTGQREVYHVLGAAQTILLEMAGRLGMSLAPLYPDHLHGPEYYPSLFRLATGADAIVQTGISADIATAAAEVEKFRQPDGELVIPDRDLGDIGWRHLHKQMRMYLMNDAQIPARLPHAHYVFWQGKDHLSIACCHMNPAYLSARLCETAPAPRRQRDIIATIDTKLPSLIRGSAYVTGVDDGMGFLELSDEKKGARPGYVPLGEFVATSLRQVGFSPRYMPFFRQICEVPIHPQETYAPADLIKAQHQVLIDAIQQELRPSAALETVQKIYGTYEEDTHGDANDGRTEQPGRQAEAATEGEDGRRAEANGRRARAARDRGGAGGRGGKKRPAKGAGQPQAGDSAADPAARLPGGAGGGELRPADAAGVG